MAQPGHALQGQEAKGVCGHGGLLLETGQVRVEVRLRPVGVPGLQLKRRQEVEHGCPVCFGDALQHILAGKGSCIPVNERQLLHEFPLLGRGEGIPRGQRGAIPTLLEGKGLGPRAAQLVYREGPNLPSASRFCPSTGARCSCADNELVTWRPGTHRKAGPETRRRQAGKQRRGELEVPLRHCDAVSGIQRKWIPDDQRGH
mmetsp:Transcript_47437/g.135367  ORF Transcript_47437/g.135367 Transcript_47437/m.135367 type:complete len:201 (+) Transcript_47437:2646-3248(+)